MDAAVPVRLLILTLVLLTGIRPSVKGSSLDPDSLVRSVPDRVTRAVPSFAGYLMENFSTEEMKVRTLYAWISLNVIYDVEQAKRPIVVESLDDLVETTLRTRKGVCQHYAETFTAVCRAMGMEAFTVQGYTTWDGRLRSNQGHAWNVARIDGTYCLFDPTWGSGYVDDGRFRKAFSWNYFMVSPDSLILTHMPFDPIWQLKSYPVTHEEFLAGRSSGQPYMNVSDSIRMYAVQTETGQAESSLRRALTMGLDIPELTILANRFITYTEEIRGNYYITMYNEAVTALHTAVDQYNAFQELRRKSYSTANQLRKLLDVSHAMAEKSRELILRIVPGRYVTERELKSFLQDIRNLQDAIREAMKDSSFRSGG